MTSDPKWKTKEYADAAHDPVCLRKTKFRFRYGEIWFMGTEFQLEAFNVWLKKMDDNVAVEILGLEVPEVKT